LRPGVEVRIDKGDFGAEVGDVICGERDVAAGQRFAGSYVGPQFSATIVALLAESGGSGSLLTAMLG
jgi:hypothetical protein